MGIHTQQNYGHFHSLCGSTDTPAMRYETFTSCSFFDSCHTMWQPHISEGKQTRTVCMCLVLFTSRESTHTHTHTSHDTKRIENNDVYHFMNVDARAQFTSFVLKLDFQQWTRNELRIGKNLPFGNCVFTSLTRGNLILLLFVLAFWNFIARKFGNFSNEQKQIKNCHRIWIPIQNAIQPQSRKNSIKVGFYHWKWVLFVETRRFHGKYKFSWFFTSTQGFLHKNSIPKCNVNKWPFDEVEDWILFAKTLIAL